MSNFRPSLPPGVFANPPRWRSEWLTADKGKSFGYGIDAGRQRYADVEEKSNPGALVIGWWSVRVALCFGRRAWIVYRWRERLAGT